MNYRTYIVYAPIWNSCHILHVVVFFRLWSAELYIITEPPGGSKPPTLAYAVADPGVGSPNLFDYRLWPPQRRNKRALGNIYQFAPLQGRPQAGARWCTCTPPGFCFSGFCRALGPIHAQPLTQRHRQTLFYRVKYDSRCWCSTSRHYRQICSSTID